MTAVLLSALALGLTGCGGGSADSSGGVSSAASPTPISSLRESGDTPPVPPGCTSAALPAVYREDGRHSGALSATAYSSSADVQAALLYDQYQSGLRAVFTRTAPAPRTRITGVVSCVAMHFPTTEQAARFFSSYRYLRKQAGRLARRLPIGASLGSATRSAAYLERRQSFRGYHIASTDVAEVAAQSGSTLWIASVAARQPSVSLARSLLVSMLRADARGAS
ncbi:MAG TPA: hypothetical protein VG708_12980 [Mycobacteriales bacterium]|nr:hypothetical protein [Mycobacteriales bacterium]